MPPWVVLRRFLCVLEREILYSKEHHVNVKHFLLLYWSKENASNIFDAAPTIETMQKKNDWKQNEKSKERNYFQVYIQNFIK